MSKKSGQEFLELFRRVPAKEPSGDASRSVRGVAEGRFTVTFGVKEVALFVLVLVAIVVVSHLWGVHRGRSDSTAVAPASRPTPAAQAGSTGRAPAVASSAETPRSGGPSLMTNAPAAGWGNTAAAVPFHTVRIIAAVRLAGAREVCAKLRAEGYDAFIVKPASDNMYTVNVGRFRSKSDAQAVALKERMLAIKDSQGRSLYEGAYFVQISDKRSIVE